MTTTATTTTNDNDKSYNNDRVEVWSPKFSNSGVKVPRKSKDSASVVCMYVALTKVIAVIISEGLFSE